MRKKFLRISLACSYFFVMFLAPWFHVHPGQDHQHANGDSYHSHAEPFHSHSSERDRAEPHATAFPNHLTQITTPVTNGVLLLLNWAWEAPLLSGETGFDSEPILQDNSDSFNLFESIIPPLRQEKYVQFTTNLSPPLI